MRKPLDCTFMEQRIGQLLEEAIDLPEGSLEQQRIEKLISELQDKLIARLERMPRPAALSAILSPQVISN